MPETDPSARPFGDRPPAGDAQTEEQPGLIDVGTEFVKTAVTYVRQETGDLVREKVVLPTQRAGTTFGLAIGIALVLVLGVGFLSVGLLMLLASWITWPGALILIGVVLVVVSGIIAYIRARSMQS